MIIGIVLAVLFMDSEDINCAYCKWLKVIVTAF